MRLGRKILNLRLDLRLEQHELAERCDVSPSAICKIETGVHRPRGPLAAKIAKVLDVPVEYLLDDSAAYPYPGTD